MGHHRLPHPAPAVVLPDVPPRRSLLTEAVRSAIAGFSSGAISFDEALKLSQLGNRARFEFALAEHAKENP